MPKSAFSFFTAFSGFIQVSHCLLTAKNQYFCGFMPDYYNATPTKTPNPTFGSGLDFFMSQTGFEPAGVNCLRH